MIKRKESSYIVFIKLVREGSMLYKKLISVNNRLEREGFVENLTCILFNLDFIKLCWVVVKVRNKKIGFRKDTKLLEYQFNVWYLKRSKELKAGSFFLIKNYLKRGLWLKN